MLVSPTSSDTKTGLWEGWRWNLRYSKNLASVRWPRKRHNLHYVYGARLFLVYAINPL